MPQDLIGCRKRRKLKALIPRVVVFVNDTANRRVNRGVGTCASLHTFAIRCHVETKSGFVGTSFVDTYLSCGGKVGSCFNQGGATCF